MNEYVRFRTFVKGPEYHVSQDMHAGNIRGQSPAFFDASLLYISLCDMLSFPLYFGIVPSSAVSSCMSSLSPLWPDHLGIPSGTSMTLMTKTVSEKGKVQNDHLPFRVEYVSRGLEVLWHLAVFEFERTWVRQNSVATLIEDRRAALVA